MSDFAERLEDLRICQQARVIVNVVSEAFAGCRDYWVRDQIQRAAVSSMNNIAEGFERRAAKDLGYFLDIAKLGVGGSASYTLTDRRV
ncbi:MAG TPA: hypothetical protein DD423_04265 [Opitutae bacterium]|nr:hypothetical protein [Opitutae bacterium]